MYLHHDRDLFLEIIDITSTKCLTSQSIIEKDYYVTMILRLLSQSHFNPVFKGGTSLSKCFHLIDRFSEDIDITFTECLGDRRRKKLKYDVVGPIREELGLDIQNWNKIESNKDLIRYEFVYQPVSSASIQDVTQCIKLETFTASYSFPIKKKLVGNYIYDTLKDEIPDLDKYGLAPFGMNVQSEERTFIDKIFALCDYYSDGKARNHSRHLYDVYKLFPLIAFDDAFKKLFEDVRKHRSRLKICPSAKEGVNLKERIAGFLDSDFYRQDYEEKTKTLISDGITYDQAVATLRKLTDILFKG